MDNDLTSHARTLVRFAVVAVGTRNVKLVGHLFARAVEVILVGDGVGVDARRDVVFVENNVVRERLVVHELNGFALGNSDGVRLFISCTSRSIPHTSVIAFAFAFARAKPP